MLKTLREHFALMLFIFISMGCIGLIIGAAIRMPEAPKGLPAEYIATDHWELPACPDENLDSAMLSVTVYLWAEGQPKKKQRKMIAELRKVGLTSEASKGDHFRVVRDLLDDPKFRASGPSKHAWLIENLTHPDRPRAVATEAMIAEVFISSPSLAPTAH